MHSNTHDVPRARAIIQRMQELEVPREESEDDDDKITLADLRLATVPFQCPRTKNHICDSCAHFENKPKRFKKARGRCREKKSAVFIDEQGFMFCSTFHQSIRRPAPQDPVLTEQPKVKKTHEVAAISDEQQRELEKLPVFARRDIKSLAKGVMDDLVSNGDP